MIPRTSVRQLVVEPATYAAVAFNAVLKMCSIILCVIIPICRIDCVKGAASACRLRSLFQGVLRVRVGQLDSSTSLDLFAEEPVLILLEGESQAVTRWESERKQPQEWVGPKNRSDVAIHSQDVRGLPWRGVLVVLGLLHLVLTPLDCGHTLGHQPTVKSKECHEEEGEEASQGFAEQGY